MFRTRIAGKSRRKAHARPAALIGLILLAACSQVTMRPEGGRKDTRAAGFEARQQFWLWGLVGEGHVDAKQACGEKRIEQMQAVYSGMDVLLNIVTLGTYAPRSARIWCG